MQNQQGCRISAAVITKPLRGIIRPSNRAKIAIPQKVNDRGASFRASPGVGASIATATSMPCRPGRSSCWASTVRARRGTRKRFRLGRSRAAQLGSQQHAQRDVQQHAACLQRACADARAQGHSPVDQVPGQHVSSIFHAPMMRGPALRDPIKINRARRATRKWPRP